MSERTTDSLIQDALDNIRPVLEDVRSLILQQYPRGIVYLSGAIEYTSDYKTWRKILKEELAERDIYAIDIGEIDSNYEKIYGKLDVPFWHENIETINDWIEKKAFIISHIILTDLALIEIADGLIVYYDQAAKKGAGTIGECQYVGERMRPIFVVSAFESYEEIPLWLQGLVTKIFFSWKEMFDFIDENEIDFTNVNSFYSKHIEKDQYVELAEKIIEHNSNMKRLDVAIETIIKDIKGEE